MRASVQTLESRLFLSVTPMTLSNDLQGVQVDDAADRAALTALADRSATDLKALKKDIKGSGSTNKALLNAVEAAEGQYIAKLDYDVNKLLSATGVAQRSVSDGTAFIHHPSNRLSAQLNADITVLNTAGAPISDIRIDEQNTSVSAALAALVSANSSNAKLVADAAKLNGDNAIVGATIIADSQTYVFSLGDLSNDLSRLIA